MELAILPNSSADAAKLLGGLGRLTDGDEALSFDHDSETGATILHGTSEAQLDAHVEILRSVYGVDADFGCAQVAYVETVAREVELKYTHKRQAGRSGQYAEVRIVFEPAGQNAGVVFENKLVPGVVPAEFVPAVERGVRVAAETGVIAGFRTVDFKFSLVDGNYHDVDSSALAFEIASKACFRELKRTGAARLLEPVMRVEVVTPRDCAAAIVDDLKRRGGRLEETIAWRASGVVTALVPLSAMLRYRSELEALSRGLGRFSMVYDGHREMTSDGPPDDRFPPAMALRA